MPDQKSNPEFTSLKCLLPSQSIRLSGNSTVASHDWNATLETRVYLKIPKVNHMKGIAIILFAISTFSFEAHSQQTAENTVRELYQLVSTEKNEFTDWDLVRTHFIPEGLIAMRITSDSSAVFSLEEWIQDFKTFVEQRNIAATGFKEQVVHLDAWEMGNIAQVNVIYASTIPGITGPHKGVDCFHLIKQGNDWKIISIINEIPSEKRPIPEVIAKEK